jgi:hypothetical protein
MKVSEIRGEEKKVAFAFMIHLGTSRQMLSQYHEIGHGNLITIIEKKEP